MFFRALLGWLGLFELLAGIAQLRGLAWSDRRLRGMAGALLLAAWRDLRGWRGPAALATSLPAAVVLQAGLASLRIRRLNPLDRLSPGDYADRQIRRMDVPTSTGDVPALEIVPHGGSRTVVCVAHGSGCDKYFYAWRLVDELLDRGFALLLIDLDGHGESRRPQAFPTIVFSLRDCLDWLRARYERVALLGMSLGGCVAARAVAEGAAVAALALLEAPIKVRLSQADRRKVVQDEGLRLLRPALLSLLRDGSPYHIARAWSTSGIRAEIGTWDLFDMLDLAGSLRRIATGAAAPPLLAIYGSRDTLIPPAMAERVRELLPAGAAYHMLAGASHISLPIEERTLRIVGEWMTRTCTPDE